MSLIQCCCTSTCASVADPVVKGCFSLALSGASCTLKQGTTTVTTWTTNSLGKNPAGALSLAPGSYTLVTTKARFDSTTSFVNVPSNCAPTVVNVTLTPSTGYVCCGNSPDPYPTTLHVTDSTGSYTVTYASFLGSWTTSRSIPGVASEDTSTCTANTVSVSMETRISCSSILYIADAFDDATCTGLIQYSGSFVGNSAANYPFDGFTQTFPLSASVAIKNPWFYNGGSATIAALVTGTTTISE